MRVAFSEGSASLYISINDAFTPATGTYCQIECINDAKSNSAFNLMY